MQTPLTPLSAVTRAALLSTSLGLAVASLVSAPARAAILTWDVSPGTTGAGNGTVTGGTGAWNTTDTLGNWTADGGATNVAWVNDTPPDEAIFDGIGGNVTQDAVIVNKMTFNVPGYSILNGTLTLAGSLPGITTHADTGIFCTVTGTEGMTKDGGGSLNLFTRATYTGGTVIDSGTLSLNGGGGATGAIRGVATVNAGATLQLNTGDATGYNTGDDRVDTINLDGGTLHINVVNNQTLGSAVINMTGGAITGIPTSNLDFFQGGSAVNSLAAATPSTISGVRIAIRQTPGITFTVADGAAPVDLEVASEIRNSTANAPLIKAGAGTMLLSGANIHTGPTIVNGGTLALGGGSAIADSSSIVLADTPGATLRLDASETIGALAGGGTSGGVVDLQGHTLTVSNAANSSFAGALAGTGSLIKENTGTLTLSGSGNHDGSTTVTANEGTLNLTGSLTHSALTIADGSFISGEGSAASITLGSGSGADLLVDPSTPGALTATGTLTVNGTAFVTLNGPITGSSFKVVEFGSNGGFTAANFALNNPWEFRPGASFTVNPNDVTLNYGGRKSLEWTAATDNFWEVAGEFDNFRDTGTLAAEPFFTADDVLFGDLPGDHQTIDVVSIVAPSFMVVDSSYNYTFTGGSIGGGVLTKAGSGTLTLGSANSYSGGTEIGQGSVVLNNVAAAGSGPIILGNADSGTSVIGLTTNAGSGVFTNPVTVTADGTGLVTLSQAANFSTFAGQLTLNRPTTIQGIAGDRTGISGKITGDVGTLTFSGLRTTLDNTVPNDFTGDVVISPGATLQPNTAAGLPGTASVTINGNGRFLLNNGHAQTIDALNGGTPGFTGVQITAGAATTLTIGSAGGSGAFHGNIANGSTTLSLIKAGNGGQILAGNLTYTGPTHVNAGLLQVPAGVTLTGGITVADAATLVVANGSGPTLTTNNLTLGSATGASLELKNFTSNPATPAVNATAALTANGAITIKVGGSFTTTGTFPLIDYASRSGTADFQLDTSALPRGVTASLVENTEETRLDLVVSAATPLTWVGDKGTQWDIATTGNWKLGVADETYLEGDQVLFDDSAAGGGNVVISGTVNPSNMTFANTVAKPYTLGGGVIGGSSPLMKTGDGPLTITGSHSFTGTTTVSAGTLNLGDGSADGAVGGAIVNDATVNFNTLGAVTLPGGLGGTGNFFKKQAGTLVIAGAGNPSGNVNVENGVLQIGNGISNGSFGTANYLLSPGTRLHLNYATAVQTSNTGWSTGITGSGLIELSSAQALNGSANWGPNSATAVPFGEGFTGVLQVNRGRFDSSPAGLGGMTRMVLNDGSQFLAWTGAYTLPIEMAGNGWGEGGQAGVLRVAGGHSATFSGDITLTGNAGINSQTAASSMTINGVISGAFNVTKHNPGPLILAAANTYGGTTTVSGGTIRLDHPLALQNSTLTTGGVTFGSAVAGNAFTLGGLQGAGNLALQNTGSAPVVLTVGANGETTTHSGQISGPGSLVKTGAGTLTLEGFSDYTGNTTVNQGILAVAHDIADGSTVSVAGGAKLQLDVAGDSVSGLILGGDVMEEGTYDATTHPAFLSGPGSLVVGGSGFDSWAAAMGLDGTPGKENGPDDDPDMDGMSNLIEFYFDGDPLASDPSILPAASLDEAGYLVLAFKRRDDAEAEVASQSAQYGTTLASWTGTAIGAESSTDENGVIVTVVENGGEPDDITVKIPRDSNTKLFGRIEVTK